MKCYLEPSMDQGMALMLRGGAGPVVMLNLLRLRAIADYTAAPDLAPESPISGRAAFDRYVEHATPFLLQSGGELLFLGDGGSFLIGPTDERWDIAMLVRQASISAFMAFASNEAYLAGLAHRSAALEDSRLLPLVDRLPIV